MDKAKPLESRPVKPITRNRIVTLEELEAFKQDLLVSIRALIVQYRPQPKR